MKSPYTAKIIEYKSMIIFLVFLLSIYYIHQKIYIQYNKYSV